MIAAILMPSLGATGGSITIEQWLVAEGTYVQAGQPLVTVVTDKATVEVEAFRAGYVRKHLVAEGAAVEVGAAIALIADTLEEPLAAEAAPVTPAKPAMKPEAVPRRRPRAPAPAQRAHAPPRTGSVTTREPAEIPADLLLGMYRQMVRIRRFEDRLYQLFLQGLVPGTLHQAQGQEAIAAGVCAALRRDDVIFSTHRPVAHVLAKGASMSAVAAELWGKATGCAGGKGGQMHLSDVSCGVLPTNAIVGANAPIATGAALGFRLMGSDRVAVSFFGDGAVNTGALHEGINLAAVKDAPVVFVCENNQYAASTHVSLNLRLESISERARAYGIPGSTVDGTEVVEVYRAAALAVARARRGEGPTLLEFTCYRFMGHSRGDPGNYRAREELEAWRRRDPIPKCRALLLAEHGQDEESLQSLEAACDDEAAAAIEFAMTSPAPAPEEAMKNVYVRWQGS